MISVKIVNLFCVGNNNMVVSNNAKIKAKIAKNKCTHRSTNPFDASISTVASLLLLCGYTPSGDTT